MPAIITPTHPTDPKNGGLLCWCAALKVMCALVITRKAYGSVWDRDMFFPDKNFAHVVEREVALNRPSVVILQSSSVDITVLKEKKLTWDQMVQAAKKSSSDIYILAQKLSTDPQIKRIILSERTPRIDSARNSHLTELANEELHLLHSRPSQTCTKIHIGTHTHTHTQHT